MYLKRLDILGFKSFANKTSVKFSTGITAVVGPNGCGKTNILDALRWVMGEQKVTLLRGSKMEEVIFNGTRDQKPLGMAEVTLSLVNNRGILPTEYTEVQITRRLFRSGESEYLLNKVPCRLKDITELFYDTGLGAHSYSVIQQDMIDSVISDKAEERRFLFEEAAGITKYKQRKKAALRKLEATDYDLLRLKDIYSEVKTRVNSLNRQYKKAERYQIVKEDIKKWELHLTSQQIKNLEKERREIRAKLDESSNIIIERESGIDRVSAQLETERKQQIDLEHELNRIGSNIYEITEKSHNIEKQISILQEKEANAKTLIERDNDDINALSNRLTLLKEQTQDATKELEELKNSHSKIHTELKEFEEIQEIADRNLLQGRNQKDAENKRLIVLESKISSGKTEDDNLKQQETEHSELIKDLSSQLESGSSQQMSLRSNLEEKRRNLHISQNNKLDQEEKQRQLKTELEELIELNEELSNELTNLTASIEAAQARKTLLEEMILHYEGYQSGVVATMEVKERWSDIEGTVADMFVPDKGMEIALEAVLGEISGFLICKNKNSAEQIIEYLKKEKKGKIGILVENTGTINPLAKRPELNMPEFIGWLDNFVNTIDNLTPLMKAILSRIAVFKAGHSPDDILMHLPYGFKAVSTDGDVYSSNFISGGTDDSLPLFRRKEKVLELEKEIKAMSSQMETTRTKKNNTNARIAEARAESGKISELIESLTEKIKDKQKDADETGYQLRTIENESQRIQRELQNNKNKLEKIRSRQYSLELDYNQLNDQKELLLNSMTIAGGKLEDLETHANESSAKVSAMQIKLVETQGKIDQTKNKIKYQLEIQNDITNTTQIKHEEIRKAHQEIDSSENHIEELEVALKDDFETREKHIAEQTSFKTKQSEITQYASAKEDTLKRLRSEKDDNNKKHHEFDIRMNTIDSELKTVSERIFEEYDIDIRSIETPRPDENLDNAQALALLHEQKEKLKKFGAVNLLALEEYEEANKREKFLNEQLTDLSTAKNDLETTINKINNTAKQMFTETFEKVQENFKKLFVELFTGGEASLQLENPSNPLESGIEIIARPRGKKLLSITMMSGGERALTAISLLFALYLVKPSPYCILDEIDAPLDDANCHRFLNMLDSFSAKTQFIIITHNKITMEAAHNLYGITMAQPGISKLVGVKFNEVENDEAGDIVIISPSTNKDTLDENNIDENIELPNQVVDRLSSTVNTQEDNSENTV